MGKVEKFTNQGKGSLPVVGGTERRQLNEDFLEPQLRDPSLDPLPNGQRILPQVPLGLDDPVGLLDLEHKIEKLRFPPGLDKFPKLGDLVFLNLDAKLTEMSLGRPMVGVGLEDHLKNLEGLFLVPAAGSRTVFPEERTVLGDLLVVEAIEQIDVLFGPIGTEVKALFLASAPPLAIVGERELFHEGKDVGRLLRQLTGGEVLARANERNAMLETLVDLGPVFGVFLGQGVENRIRGGILAQGLFDSVDESVDIHGL